ncbi:uncharacterized protein LOC120635687 isoform X2 [Pararge aegeria]|uniref:uncharacterized protein LOC120635687 isoform X2 n=1 Tax=Pararge aegeria TaxID=116150 RepID=UPI0019D10642|nr:uncharacterized protein LOC120635687 isoform X2 [Pararge aegeria]
MLLNKYFSSMQTTMENSKHGDITNDGINDHGSIHDDNVGFEQGLDPELEIEYEQLQLDYLKLQEEQIQCKQRMLILNRIGKKPSAQKFANRCILPDGRVVVRNFNDRSADQPDSIFNSAAGDSRALNSCSCDQRAWNEAGTSGSSSASTCVLCSEDRSVTIKDKSPVKYGKAPDKYVKSISTVTKSVDLSKTDKKSECSRYSKMTEVTKSIISKSDYSRVSETVTKQSDVTSKRLTKLARKSDVTCDIKCSDFYSDSDDEADETNRLIILRNADYMDIVDEKLKIVITLAGYPKLKMRLKQMEQFQHSLNSIINMQLKAGLMKQTPQFLDYYLNRGAIVCICKDVESRDWVVRITPGLRERMFNNLILLKAKVKRLCLAVIKIPKSCWPATAHDAFKLLQYFNPTLKTHLWKIYAQKIHDDVEVTSFLVDRVSGEIIRGPNFKNIIDYDQMEFELTGYSEIYYECFLSESDEDLSSVASRVKVLEELRSNQVTPRNKRENVNDNIEHDNKNDTKSTVNVKECREEIKTSSIQKINENENKGEIVDFKENLASFDVKKAPKEIKIALTEKASEIIASLANDNSCEDLNMQIAKVNESEMELNEANISIAAVSDVTESVIESSEHLFVGRNSNLHIDSNRGIAYHRRTNYLHIENELKIAIVLEGYPQNKLEGTHIRRLKHLFKDYLHKDMKMQRFTNFIIPKFQDIYLSNGAVIYICDSLETKDYVAEILPKFVTATGLKLTFRDIRNLVRYTRIVMRLPKELANVGSREILLKLQEKYPKLKLDCWKYYSDVAGKQKRQFGVEPESLDVIKSPNFDPTYENEKIAFRIIDRQKPEVNLEESNCTVESKEIESEEAKILRDRIVKTMYNVIEPDKMNATLTKIRANHYSDVIADDFKLYVGPANYPEMRIDEAMYLSIKKIFENVVFEAIYHENDKFIPKIHDFYLFDGVIFIICQDMASRLWIEKNIKSINDKLNGNLKATEFRGAVGIISMVVKTSKDFEEVIDTLQKQNPRLRTKYWRKISTVKSKVKLDVVLQIDKLSAYVITDKKFNNRIGESNVEFNLGHLKSLLQRKTLEELSKVTSKKHTSKDKVKEKTKTNVDQVLATSESNNSHKTSTNVAVSKTKTEDAKLIMDKDLKLNVGESKILFYSKSSDKDSINSFNYIEENEQGFTKMVLKIPTHILPDFNDGLEIIFDLLEDKNPGLNTELWKVEKKSQVEKGRFIVLVDKQSASVIKGKQFDPTLGGEKLKFYF